nr:MAG TPA: hypothetical protein [Caudoviricetes sp.]
MSRESRPRSTSSARLSSNLPMKQGYQKPH